MQTTPRSHAKGTERTGAPLAFAIMLTSLGILGVVPAATATHCGTLTTDVTYPADGSVQPYVSTPNWAIIEAWFTMEAGDCGVLGHSMYIDGLLLPEEASYLEHLGGGRYHVSTRPWPETPGQHTVSIFLHHTHSATEATWQFELSPTQAGVPWNLWLTLPPSYLTGAETPIASVTLYLPGFETRTWGLVDLQRTSDPDYVPVLHTPLGDVPLVNCAGCPRPLITDTSVLLLAEVTVAGTPLVFSGPVGMDL